MLTDEYRYKILKLIEARPSISQRELAGELGVSLGKVNFCLKSLVEVGLIKVTNFRNSKNKLGYMYLLTPAGIEKKASVTLSFLKYKIEQFNLLQQEIEKLELEAGCAGKAISSNFNNK